MLITELTDVVWDLASTASSQGIDLENLSSLFLDSEDPEDPGLPKCVVRPF